MKNPVHPGEILREDVLVELGLERYRGRVPPGGLARDLEQGASRACSDQPEPGRASGGGRRRGALLLAGHAVGS
ncbi:MAG: hypothetical protein QG597_4404 [Actinomycetota bacterium]|nr:hypothetical protein [Actinomycetota bacterium]